MTKTNLAVVLAILLAFIPTTLFASSTIFIHQTRANLTIKISVPNLTTPINPSSLVNVTNIYLNSSNSNTIYLRVLNTTPLFMEGVNVIIPKTSASPPFITAAQLGITPGTRSGTYDITIIANGTGFETNWTVVHLHVFNPTNSTFLFANSMNIPSATYAQNEIKLQNSQHLSNGTKNQTSQNPLPSGSISLSLAIGAIAVILILIFIAIKIAKK